MSDNIEIRVKEILGREFGGFTPYIELFGDEIKIDGQFTIEELKAIVQAWEEIEKEGRGNE